jgi:flavin reductase (DIM6/NTAB) family NADH-FMN oxidoreductase RutF
MFEEANPRQVICVTTRAEMEILGKKQIKDNIFTLAWHAPISFDPKLYGIIVGKERYSFELIEKSKCFVVNFIPKEWSEQALFVGKHSGKHIDKFEKTGLEKIDAETIDCCRLKDCAGFLECEVIYQIELGDHVLFVGKVLKSSSTKQQRLFYLGNNEFTSTIRP